MSTENYWFVSIPNEHGVSGYSKLTREFEYTSLCTSIHKVHFPSFRVGTLDSLLSISDRLSKDSKTLEASSDRLLRQYRELTGNESIVPLVEGQEPVKFVVNFEWDEARFASTESIPTLVNGLMEQVVRLEEDLKLRAVEYQTTKQAKQTIERKSQGTLMARSLAGLVKEEHVIETEHMTTVFVVTSTTASEEFESCYESLHPLVVPRSCKVVASDSDAKLYAIVVMKKGAEGFKSACREKRYTVREYVYDPVGQAVESEELKRLAKDADSQASAFCSWTETAFAEVFMVTVHVKVLRMFVESVLRYGLPVDFEMAVIQPGARMESKLRETLNGMFMHLGGNWASNAIGDEQMIPGIHQEKEFYPYVYDDLLIAKF
eukprot:CAMPEP_0182447858 /NCGR_PEP_ID=MMETSP1172-20130603/20960_1 /TAXON_ID=708627 /ORGANISM="Timspurckia oligopyrenoides, Strain CCMP3278" /LENGTH=375 /DNA_ID=CAMNT_0024644473 /DNA_START=90 /DNA_END=1217 /DNA_ORIENTATION=+